MDRHAPYLAGLLIAAAPWARAADEPTRRPGAIVLKHCAMTYEKSTLLGASQGGMFQECLVRPGDRVKAGQILGRLDDQDVRLDRELRAAEAEDDLAIRLGLARHAQALAKLKASESLSRRNVISAEELTGHRLEADAAGLTVEEAKHRRRMARISLRQIEATIRAREFVSPHEGIVVAVLKSPGESIAANDPIFRVVNTDRLRVTGSLDVADLWRARAGQTVRVRPEIPGADLPVEHEVFTGTVELVDTQVDPDSQTCKVVAVVENRADLLRGGLEAQVEIQADGALANQRSVSSLVPESDRPSSP